MDQQSYDIAAKIIRKTYVDQGRDSRRTHQKHIRALLEHGSLPEKGWSNQRIELLLQELSLMDSNNFPENVGAGEREGRVASELVAQRHYRFVHGIGRSGDITEVQPKAAGSSIVAKVTTKMVLGLIQSTGVSAARSCILLPVATGMAMLLTLLAIRQQRPQARYVVWPRVDQKSCFKCIVSAGFEPVVVENVLEGDELRTDVHAIDEQLRRLGPENVACVLTTTSCFAPRGLDRVTEVAQVCKTSGVPHIINNAYGIQSSKCMHSIQEAHRTGRVDAFIQSTDKNLMVPVGGSIVASSNEPFIQAVAQTYPGRASISPVMDVFITLLSLGSEGYGKLCADRKETFECLMKGLREVAEKYGERLLDTPTNTISIGVTLSPIEANWTEFGSMLFVKSISGTRVVVPRKQVTIGPHTFHNWGSHSDKYPHAYFTAAAAIGMNKDEVSTFLRRLDKTLAKFRRKHAPTMPPSLSAPPVDKEAPAGCSDSSSTAPISSLS